MTITTHLPFYMHSNEFGVWCTACGEMMSGEEIDFGTCDACGGEGIGEDDWDETK